MLTKSRQDEMETGVDESARQYLAVLQGKLKEQEQAVLETKRLMNTICRLHNEPPMFSDAELNTTSGPSLSIQSDQFYGQPLASGIRQILEMRKSINQGPATVNDIYDALKEGGYKFETKNDDNARRGLRISLMKNTATFHKLPNGKFGLLEWYPGVKPAKVTVGKTAEVEDNDHAEPE